MGRTVMPYSHVMESERERLKPFRRTLSKEDQQAFDRLFDRAKMHTSAGVYMANPWPMETILLSICPSAWNMERSSRRSWVSSRKRKSRKCPYSRMVRRQGSCPVEASDASCQGLIKTYFIGPIPSHPFLSRVFPLIWN